MSFKDREEGFFTPYSMVQIFGFAVSVLLVAFIFSVIIRPAAEKYAVAESYGLEKEAGSFGRVAVILKDYEQQACFTLMLWVFMILAYKYFLIRNEKLGLLEIEKRVLDSNTFHYTINGRIPRNEAPVVLKKIETEIKDKPKLATLLLPNLIVKGIKRFIATHSVQEASDMIKGRIDVTAERLESELSIVRYIAWAIPSIGFIGTVRGIGDALSQADQAIEGDISGVTTSLGLAFNSTLIALFISIFLMFFVHFVQSRQEGVVLAIETFCREQLIDRLELFEAKS